MFFSRQVASENFFGEGIFRWGKAQIWGQLRPSPYMPVHLN